MSNTKVGGKHLYDHQNNREVSLGELLHSGFCDTIGMYVFTMRDKRHWTRVHGSGENSLGRLFALSCLRKIEISPIYCRDLKYDSVQEIQHRPTRSGDIIQQEIPQFVTFYQKADLSRNGREINFS